MIITMIIIAIMIMNYIIVITSTGLCERAVGALWHQIRRVERLLKAHSGGIQRRKRNSVTNINQKRLELLPFTHVFCLYTYGNNRSRHSQSNGTLTTIKCTFAVGCRSTFYRFLPMTADDHHHDGSVYKRASGRS